MTELDYRNVIVRKPWGYEYLMYQNDLVGIWYLHIEYQMKTSLHCHPKKKSGLILLSGEARLSFLNDSVDLTPISKVMIRQGLFHSTAALSANGISVIEVETPVNKADLVRFEDEYDRETMPYEGSDAIVPMDDTCVTLPDPVLNETFERQLANCLLTVEKVPNSVALMNRTPGETIIVLEGALVSSTGEPILGCGDVVSTDTLTRLAGGFAAPDGLSLLTIKKAS